jgi:hypothetical protein
MLGFDLETKTHTPSLPAGAIPTSDKSWKFFRVVQTALQFHVMNKVERLPRGSGALTGR